jgi:hypothetical protein
MHNPAAGAILLLSALAGRNDPGPQSDHIILAIRSK